jgi:hypothetical protein
MKHFLLVSFVIFMNVPFLAQHTQNIRGKVVDAEFKSPIANVHVVLDQSNPIIATVTDENGSFVLEHVLVGRQGITLSSVGYKTMTIPSLLVQSAKETLLEIELDVEVFQMDEVIVTSKEKKNATNNKMTTISARTFSVEETEKYAGSRGDIARMAMNFAGVSAANDQRNDIIIRGNSPSGLLWRLEEVDIPNPNHFAENGTTGGPVGMINNNLLKNSDFFTGAFPSEYGNALSGVFDLQLRNGNHAKHEQLFQVGFNGFEWGIEGPLSKKSEATYLANFRYSTMELVDKIIDFGTSGIPKYKDLTLKFNFPLEKGNFSIFGLAGDSKIEMLDSEGENEGDLYSDEGQDLVNSSKMGVIGAKYYRVVNDKTSYKFIVSGVYQKGGTTIDTLDINEVPHPNIDHKYTEYRTSLSGYLHKKWSAKLSNRTGFGVNRMGYDLNSARYNAVYDELVSEIENKRNLWDGITLWQPYTHFTYKISEPLTLNAGLHMSYLDLNDAFTLEPRVGLKWKLRPNHSLGLAYGLHSKVQSMPVYYYGTRTPDGDLVETNKELDFTKAHHLVLGYEKQFTEYLRLKMEMYYQHLYDVPVTQNASSFSILNTGSGWGITDEDYLVNDGTGTNYGLELTLERFFNKSYYYLTTISLFQSKYKGSDGVERNTAYNGNYVANVLFGKEFVISPKNTISVDLKCTLAGGKRYTPIDLIASQTSSSTTYLENQAFSQQFDPFFKSDFKVSYKRNGKKVDQEWIFYVENFTNHKNVLYQWYSKSEQDIKNINQLGFFPMMQYRIHF